MSLGLDIQLLSFAKVIIGRQGPVVLRTNIYKHKGDEKYEGKNDVFTIGECGKQITFNDVFNTFCDIDDDNDLYDCLHSGRAYFFEGVEESDVYNTFYMKWGS